MTLRRRDVGVQTGSSPIPKREMHHDRWSRQVAHAQVPQMWLRGDYTPPDLFVPSLNMSAKCPEIEARIKRSESFDGDPRRCNTMYGTWVAAERTWVAPVPHDRSDTH